MKNQNSKLMPILSWLLPSGVELAISSALCALTITVSNASFFRDLVYLPKTFELKSAVLDSFNNLLVRLVGDSIARSAVVAIFWAVVGLIVYIFIWLSINVSSEIGNDLATTKYMHPRNVDTHSPLRNFLSRISFQFGALFVFVAYANLAIGVLLPYSGGLLRATMREWPSTQAIEYAVLGIVGELVVLHVFVILIRALVLRKRIFG